MASSEEIIERAKEAHALHSSLGLDLNQPADIRDAHRAAAKRAEGVILELFDNQGD